MRKKERNGRSQKVTVVVAGKAETVLVEIDFELAAKLLAARALRSKGRKASECGGALVVREVPT